jgi:4-amino-4-deoxy-L-arabinose transferase-like glycosyltransferase
MSPKSRKEKTVYDAFLDAVSLKGLRRQLLGTQRRQTKSRPRPAARRAPKPPGSIGGQTTAGGWISTAFWLTTIAILAVRLWKLDTLQSEMYGDITIVYEYVRDVSNGTWPFYFSLSVGPLYHYLIMPVVWIAGMSYLGFKLASVVISLGALTFTYLFARRLVGSVFAILATFIAGVSFWLLIFSRLGNVPIVVPLLTMAALWLLVRYVQERNRWDLYACAAVCALGLYAYPQAYFLAPTVVLTLLALYLTGFRMQGREWFTFFAIFVLCALPFVAMVIKDPGVFTVGYLGEKIQAEGSALAALVRNTVSAFGAYNFSGDPVFRSNPLNRPHLDLLSGILFLVGLVYWLQRPRRKAGLLLLVPFLVLHIPSILVISGNGEIPSAIRTLGAAPIAYILVASGLWAVFHFIQKRWDNRSAWMVSALVLLLISAANFRSYFVDYISDLPYHNTPIARLITNYANTLPPETQVYLSGCCWESGMPEPKSIGFEMAHPENLHRLEAADLSCTTVDLLYGPAVILWSFREPLPSPAVSQCAERFPAQLFTSTAGVPAFYAATIQGLQNKAPVESEETGNPETLNPNGLLEQALAWNGEAVLARYSPIDIGRIEDVVDGKFETLMRGRGVNPVIIEFEFDEQRVLTTAMITTGTMEHFTVKILVTYSDASTAETLQDFTDQGPDPTVEIALPESDKQVQAIRIEIADLGLVPVGGFHIHVRELDFH